MFEKVPDILTPRECMQLLKYLHSGELEGFKIGNRWRIYKYSVIDFIMRR